MATDEALGRVEPKLTQKAQRIALAAVINRLGLRFEVKGICIWRVSPEDVLPRAYRLRSLQPEDAQAFPDSNPTVGTRRREPGRRH